MLLLDEGALATALGYASIGCWLCAQLPQVIKNWQLGSCDGLSFPFLVTWLFGDLTNLIGCILTHQLPFQTYLATYFCFVDITLVCQYFYYAKKPALLLKPASPRASTTALRHVASHPRGTSPHPTPAGSLGRPPSGRGRKRPQIGIPEHVHPHTITESPVYVGPSDSVEALYAAALDVARAAERVSLRRSNSGRPRGRHAATMPPDEAGLLHSFHSDTSLHSASTDDDERAYHRMTQSTGSLLHRGRSLTRIRTPASGTATPMNEGADRLDELPESGMVEIRRGRRSASRSQSAARAARGTGRRAATVAFMSLGLLVWRASPTVQMYNAPTGSGHVVVRFEPAPPEASNAFPLHIHPVPFPFPESTASQLLWFDAPAHEPGKDDGRKERSKPQPISLQEAIGRISAWCCTTLYLSSRLPQIWKNFQRKSVEGLSILLFFFAFLGNMLYVASILLMPVKPEEYTRHVLQSLPYLLGSGGTLLFDLTIMFQAWLYGSSPPLPPPRTPLDRPRRTLSYGAMPRRRRHVEEGQPHERSRLLGGGSPMRSATEPMRPSALRLNSIDMESPVMPASGLGSGALSSTQSVATSAPQSANQSAGNSGVSGGALGVKLFGDSRVPCVWWIRGRLLSTSLQSARSKCRPSSASARRRPPPRWRTLPPAAASSALTAPPSRSSSPLFSATRCTSPSSLLAATSLPTSTSASVSRVVATSRSSTLSARPSPRASLRSTPRTRTPPRRLSSRRRSSPTTALSSLPTPAAASPRSSAVAVPVPAARSRTVKHLGGAVASPGRAQRPRGGAARWCVFALGYVYHDLAAVVCASSVRGKRRGAE